MLVTCALGSRCPVVRACFLHRYSAEAHKARSLARLADFLCKLRVAVAIHRCPMRKW